MKNISHNSNKIMIILYLSINHHHSKYYVNKVAKYVIDNMK